MSDTRIVFKPLRQPVVDLTQGSATALVNAIFSRAYSSEHNPEVSAPFNWYRPARLLLEAVLAPLVLLRDDYKLPLNYAVLRKQMELTSLEGFVGAQHSLPAVDKKLESLRAYLNSLPGYSPANYCRQLPETYETHRHIIEYLNYVFEKDVAPALTVKQALDAYHDDTFAFARNPSQDLSNTLIDYANLRHRFLMQGHMNRTLEQCLDALPADERIELLSSNLFHVAVRYAAEGAASPIRHLQSFSFSGDQEMERKEIFEVWAAAHAHSMVPLLFKQNFVGYRNARTHSLWCAWRESARQEVALSFDNNRPGGSDRFMRFEAWAASNGYPIGESGLPGRLLGTKFKHQDTQLAFCVWMESAAQEKHIRLTGNTRPMRYEQSRLKTLAATATTRFGDTIK